jgi:hypothetical protein
MLDASAKRSVRGLVSLSLLPVQLDADFLGQDNQLRHEQLRIQPRLWVAAQHRLQRGLGGGPVLHLELGRGQVLCRRDVIVRRERSIGGEPFQRRPRARELPILVEVDSLVERCVGSPGQPSPQQERNGEAHCVRG